MRLFHYIAPCCLAAALLLQAGILSSCAVFSSKQTKEYVRNGVQYGVTEGRFRGRWWNYYERGRSYLEGGFYSEAQRDLENALKGRSADQLWPRTYGLHFIPEYFPNRELGIVLYHQNQFESSITQLERSLKQRYSARAAYYLNESRKRLLESSGADVSPPVITVEGAEETVAAMEWELAGAVQDDTFVSQITVNGLPVDIKVSDNRIAFRERVSLQPGQNDIEISAMDLLGKTASTHVPIIVDVEGPALSFDEPLTLPGTLRGAAIDRTGVKAFRVGRKEASLSTDNKGITTFSLDISPQEMTTPLTYECEDVLGNMTWGELQTSVLQQPNTASIVPFGSRLLNMLASGLSMVLGVTPDSGGAVTVSLSNLQEGQQYFMHEIVVAMEIRATTVLETVRLNDEAIPIVPGRDNVHLSRRVRLEEGENVIRAAASDSNGRKGEDSTTVLRSPTEIEMTKGKLALAFLGNVSELKNPGLTQDTEYILSQLSAERTVQKRFTLVDRDLIKNILSELELSSALSSKSNKLQLCKMVPADVMLAACIRRDQESIEIVLEGTSTETGVRVAPRVDVAGPYKEMDRLIEDLGVRLAQEFPRVHGTVLDWSAPEVTCDLKESQGLRESLKCLVYRKEPVKDLNTGAVLGDKHIILGEGLVNGVAPQFCTIEMKPAEEAQTSAELPIEVGQYVVTK